MYLYLGNERVVVGEWIVDIISFQKIFGLCCLKCHIVEIWRDVTFEDRGRTDNGNVNIELESAKQDSQFLNCLQTWSFPGQHLTNATQPLLRTGSREVPATSSR